MTSGDARSGAPHAASAKPSRPPFIGAPVPALELHPAAMATLQSFTLLPQTREWYTTQASAGTSRLSDPAGLKVGDIVVSRLAPDGSLLDCMTLPDSGHGMGLIVRMEAGIRVVYSCWFAPDASGRPYDLVRLPYTPGVASRGAATTVIEGAGYPLDPSLDVSTDAVSLRHQGGGGPEYTRHEWSHFVVGDLSRPTGKIATADWPPTHQGFCSFGNRFFFYTGAASDKAGGDPALITEYSWANGEAVAPPIDASDNSRKPDGSYEGGSMEPEGATVVIDENGVPSLLVGVANGSTSAAAVPRSYRTFRYPLATGT
ncbi:hypothetical protein QDR37_03080 [Amnibacterium sp. CER49]|uniref:phage baseplate protein n=1 Tax=Amnibacterium sp. CER49 TaxID=3039161 RepID=UPI0024499936|nr:hypothetical protein [Amnibacterium sp. CER49]MDH2442922.1 hypothetical protein [Amnibacterium sp. CER49]